MTETLVQTLKSKISITEVLSDYGSDEDVSGMWKCISHNDNPPNNLSVDKDKNVCHCFRCDFGGDIFSIVMAVENCDFRKALSILAKKAGLTVNNENSEEIEKISAIHQERRIIYNIYREAADYFHSNIDELKIAKETVRAFEKRTRGFTDETINTLKIGYADDKNGLVKHFMKKYTFDELLKTGLFIQVGDDVKCFFSGRIIYPYFKHQDVVYFIARKTINTPKTDYEQGKYKKLLTKTEKRPYISELVENKYLYGENSARGDEMLITEGVTDCISLIQAGFSAVSPVTTRFRKDDLQKILELAQRKKTVYLLNDSEINDAGLKGSLDTAKYLFSNGVADVRIAQLPRLVDEKKVDVNSYVQKYSVEEAQEHLQKILYNSTQYIQFRIARLSKNVVEQNHQVKNILSELTGYEPLLQEQFLHQIEKSTKISVAKLRAELDQQLKKRNEEKLLEQKRVVAKAIVETSEEIDRISKEYTATPDYVTTTVYTTTSWGFFDKQRNVYALQLSSSKYLVRTEKTRQIVDVTVEEVKKGNKTKHVYSLLIGPVQYILPSKRYKLSDWCRIPSVTIAHQYVKGEFKVRSITEIVVDLKNIILSLFDFQKITDVDLWLLFIVQTHMKPALDNFFFCGVDATKGGGKTTLLEIMSELCRHGMLGGEVSAASLPRVVDSLDLSLFLDEIDQAMQEDDKVSILRKGQRRGNYYIRVNPNTLLAERFDVAGPHAFSYRSELEDAFMSRSIECHSGESPSSELPLVNVYKRTILSDICDELYLWGVENILSFSNCIRQVTTALSSRCSHVVSCSQELRGGGVAKLRTDLYNLIIKEFSAEEVQVLERLTGRNAELAYLLMIVCKVSGLNLYDLIKDHLEAKQSEEVQTSQFYAEELKRYLHNLWLERHDDEKFQLNDGLFSGKVFFSKSAVQKGFSQHLSEYKTPTIGVKKFASLLRDLGFRKDYNLDINQRVDGIPTRCIILTDEVMTNLGLGEKDTDVDIPNFIQQLSREEFSIQDVVDGTKMKYANVKESFAKLSQSGLIVENPVGVWRLVK